jgi:hypothetical protein
MTVFWDFAPSRLVETDRRFRGTYCLHHQGDEVDDGTVHWWDFVGSLKWIMEEKSTSKTWVNFYENIRHNIPEDSHLDPKSKLFPYGDRTWKTSCSFKRPVGRDFVTGVLVLTRDQYDARISVKYLPDTIIPKS